MRSITISLFVLFPILLFSQAHYTFMYEQGFSAHSGAENLVAANLVAANYLYATLDKNYIPSSIFKDKKVGNITYRAVKFLFVDIALNGWVFVTQHEYFGHTVRAKQAGFYDAYPIIGYPYFNEEGSKTILGKPFIRSTSYEIKMLSAGGNEANALLSKDLFAKFILDKQTLYQQNLMYISNSTYQSLGIFLVNDVSSIVDIKVYNDYTNYNNNNERVNRQMKTLALVDLLTDPMNYASLFSIFKNYIYEGKHEAKI